jgi:hypothetical protein
MSRSATAALFLVPLLAVLGCNKASETATATSATTETAAATTGDSSTALSGTAAPAPSTPPAAAAAPAPGAVIATATFSADPALRADLLEVRRVSGGALLVKWKITNTNPAQAEGLAATTAKPIYYDFAWDDVYYVDPAENKKYGYLTDTEGGRILDIFYGTLKAGESRANWAKFPAPPPSSTKISLTLPKFPPFEDVPVTP